MNLMYWITKVIFYIPTMLVYPLKVINKKRIPKKQRYIAVANHLEWADILHILYQTPGHRRMIAKKEIGENWFIKMVNWFIGIIFVDRGNSSVKSLKEILRSLKDEHPICIFPEGTRNKVNRELQEIKSGASVFAIKGDAPIIPFMIYKRTKMFRKNYIYVGEPLDLSSYKKVRLTDDVIKEADNLVREHMLKTMADMDDYIENKRWKKKNRLPAAGSVTIELDESEQNMDELAPTAQAENEASESVALIQETELKSPEIILDGVESPEMTENIAASAEVASDEATDTES